MENACRYREGTTWHRSPSSNECYPTQQCMKNGAMKWFLNTSSRRQNNMQRRKKKKKKKERKEEKKKRGTSPEGIVHCKWDHGSSSVGILFEATSISL